VGYAGGNAAISIIYGTESLHLENVQGKLKVQFMSRASTGRSAFAHLAGIPVRIVIINLVIVAGPA
jgi:hypothetical protein